MPTDSHVKKFSDWRKSDFDAHPVWTWYDSDADEVHPLDCDGKFEDADDALFAASTLTLNDGSTLPAVIGVSEEDRSIYLLTFWQPDDTPMVCSLAPGARDRFPIDKLETLLSRKRDDIFPLTYKSICAFGNEPLSGTIGRDVYPQLAFPELKKWFDEHK